MGILSSSYPTKPLTKDRYEETDDSSLILTLILLINNSILLHPDVLNLDISKYKFC